MEVQEPAWYQRGCSVPPEETLIFHLSKSVYEFVQQKLVLPQIRQLILYHYCYEELVDEFVRELTFAKQLYVNTFCEITFQHGKGCARAQPRGHLRLSGDRQIRP